MPRQVTYYPLRANGTEGLEGLSPVLTLLLGSGRHSGAGTGVWDSMAVRRVCVGVWEGARGVVVPLSGPGRGDGAGGKTHPYSPDFPFRSGGLGRETPGEARKEERYSRDAVVSAVAQARGEG